MGRGTGIVLLIIGLVSMYFYIANYHSSIPTLTMGDFGYWLFYGGLLLIIIGMLMAIFSKPKIPRY